MAGFNNHQKNLKGIIMKMIICQHLSFAQLLMLHFPQEHFN